MRSIVIADSHALCREALCEYIRHADSNYTIADAGDMHSLRVRLQSNVPDVILIEKDLPDFTEEEILRDFVTGREARFGLIISDISEVEGIDPRITGVFPKTLSCKEFMEGIQDMMAGKKFYPKTGIGIVSENIMPFKRPKNDFSLTNREKEVLSHLVKGASNKDIGRALDLQVVTVKLHVRGICRKMKAQNRTQAALIAMENGWG